MNEMISPRKNSCKILNKIVKIDLSCKLLQVFVRLSFSQDLARWSCKYLHDLPGWIFLKIKQGTFNRSKKSHLKVFIAKTPISNENFISEFLFDDEHD